MGRCRIAVLALVLAACWSTASRHDAGSGRDAAIDANVERDGGPIDAALTDRRANDAALTDAEVAEGSIDPHAIYLATCPPTRVDPNLPIGTDAPGTCTRSSDCTNEPNGRCIGYVEGSQVMYPRCVYADCARDGECPGDQQCECTFGGEWRCLRVDCRVDADCNDGQRCLRMQGYCVDNRLGEFICTTPDDECVSHQDCVNETGNVCTRDGLRRVCSFVTCED